MNDIDEQVLFGKPKEYTFNEAILEYIKRVKVDGASENTIKSYAAAAKAISPFVGGLAIHDVVDESFDEYRANRGRSAKTMSNELSFAQSVLRAASLWRDENGQPWLRAAPTIRKMSKRHRVESAKNQIYLTWEQQGALLAHLTPANQIIAEFILYTGLRDTEACSLRWEWFVKGAKYPAFIIPAHMNKNLEPRLVVLNAITCRLVDECRGHHPELVFGRKTRLHNTNWKSAWIKAGLKRDGYLGGPHNLRHTFGARLRAMGISSEDRKVFMGHVSSDITTHYSLPHIQSLEKILDQMAAEKPEIVST